MGGTSSSRTGAPAPFHAAAACRITAAKPAFVELTEASMEYITSIEVPLGGDERHVKWVLGFPAGS